MLLLNAFSNPKNVYSWIHPAIASRASKGFPMVYYEMREITLYLWIVGPIEQFRSFVGHSSKIKRMACKVPRNLVWCN